MTHPTSPPDVGHQTIGRSDRGLDPRRNAFRADLAAVDLRGKVNAASFVAGEERQVIHAAVPLRARPDLAAPLDTELLYGERVIAFETREGWSWVQVKRDRYVGYLPAAALSSHVRAATHKVHTLGTFVYPAADIKTPPLLRLSLGAEITVAQGGETFAQLAGGGYVVSRHIIEIGRHHRDFVEVAEQFIGTPYLWGGRTDLGIDCSGLVQVSLEASGIPAPRDSDMQRSELGDLIAAQDDLVGLERGDLIFWKGHVGIMVDRSNLLHANAHHMAVAVESLTSAVERISKTGSEILAIRRISKPAV